jgi:hypothetical protein
MSVSTFLSAYGSMVLPLIATVFATQWIVLQLDALVPLSGPYHLVLYSLLAILSFGLFSLLQDRVFQYLKASPNRKGKPLSRGARALRFIVMGLLIPLLLAELDHPIRRLWNSLFGHNQELAAVTRIGNSVLSSKEIKVKEAGIEALANIATRDSVEEVGRILDTEQECFKDAECYNATRSAFLTATDASVPRTLLEVLEHHLKDAQGPGASQVSLSQRYFDTDLSALRGNIRNAALNSKSQEDVSSRLDALQAQLESGLSDIQKQLPPAPDRSALIELILDVYASREERVSDGLSKLPEDPEANSQMSKVAQKIVEDNKYPPTVRAKALLLVGQVGTNSDKEWVLNWIDDPDEILKVAAMGAYSTLDSRIRHSSN